MSDLASKEETVYGAQWNNVHEGYFSSPEVANALIQKIHEIAYQSRPNKIIDLGGGTGFLLSDLDLADIHQRITLIDLDNSAAQLSIAKSAGLSCVQSSVDTFSRADVGNADQRFLFIMRSVLHYFGKDGLRAAIRHIREQARPGDYFIHQSASFSNSYDADCINRLYNLLNTGKWYPTIDFMKECLLAENWHVEEICPALPLKLRSEDLMQRYHLDDAGINRIGEQLFQNSNCSENILVKTDGGFCASLNYSIYICTPIPAPSILESID